MDQTRKPPKTHHKKVAVIETDAAGLGCAAQLNRAGHHVTVYERADRIGGLLMYGIPNFKLEKHLVDRRVDQMKAEGVKFVTNANVGFNVRPSKNFRQDFDSIVLCGALPNPAIFPFPAASLVASITPWITCPS